MFSAVERQCTSVKADTVKTLAIRNQVHGTAFCPVPTACLPHASRIPAAWRQPAGKRPCHRPGNALASARTFGAKRSRGLPPNRWSTAEPHGGSLRANAQWQSLWFFYGWIFTLLFLFLAFSLHEFGGLLPSGVRFAFVAAARAIRQLVLRRDVERFFVAD